MSFGRFFGLNSRTRTKLFSNFARSLEKLPNVENKVVDFFTEITPNPASLKFVSNAMLLPQRFVDYKSAEEAEHSPLAQQLFSKPYVKGVFISNNFVTVSKTEKYEWHEIKGEVREFLKNYLNTGGKVMSESYWDEAVQAKKQEADKDEISTKIIELLDKYVKPAIEMDGGHIAFKSFDDGIVTLELQGACSGCPSASVTLKGGVEGLLKRMVPEVKEVVSEEV